MPTAAKLLAALAFALVAFLAAEAFKPLMPEETVFGWFSQICAVFGALCGWMVMGSRAGRGWTTAMGVGLTTSAAVAVVSVFAFSGREMVFRSMNRRYDGPMEAVVGTFDIALDYGWRMADAQVLGILAGGGILAGLITEFAARRWK
jgi:hypothetical protein